VLVTGSRDTTVLVWDLALLGKRLPARGCGHEAPVTSVAVCEESHSCASGSADGSVILRETHSAKFLHSFAVGETIERLCAAPGGDLFAATPSRVLLLNVARVPQQRTLFELVEPLVDMGCRGAWFVCCFKFRLFVVRGGAMVHDVQMKDEVYALCFSGPNSVIAAHGNGTVSVVEFE
jgi:WD40 repeat protein